MYVLCTCTGRRCNHCVHGLATGSILPCFVPDDWTVVYKFSVSFSTYLLRSVFYLWSIYRRYELLRLLVPYN